MAQIVPHPAFKPEVAEAPAVTHVDALPPGTRLSEFEIQGLLGVGGFGLVYRAYDTSLLRTVAIKEYMPAALATRLDGITVSVRSSVDEGTYRSGLQSFIAEARLLAQFDHPSLVKVYRFFEAHNTAYMVMPLYSGMTLKQARSQMVAPPPEEWLRTVLWSVLQGLHVLHRSDALHRDVSPDNIFLQDIGPPVLLDLGAARRAIHDKSHKLTAILKVNYAPIEQFAEAEDLQQGPWTDLYSLAAVVYSCLRNDPPLPATTRVVRDSQPSVRSVAATVREHFGLTYSEPFVRTIQHALSVQPSDRPKSLAAFVTEMKLKAPPRLSKFDWRAELGASLRKEEDDYNSRQFWHTQPQDAAAAAQASARSP
ncbi:MAG: serine/threonine-protein kinase [Curvibacter sp.]